VSGDDADPERRVRLALHWLHRSLDVEHPSPTKQHGACLIEGTPAVIEDAKRCGNERQ
jgi:hypothetical protein